MLRRVFPPRKAIALPTFPICRITVATATRLNVVFGSLSVAKTRAIKQTRSIILRASRDFADGTRFG